MKELHLNEEEVRMFDAASDNAFIKTYRKDALTYAIAKMEPVLREIGKRTGYTLEDVRACHPTEVQSLFNGVIKKDELDARGKYLAYELVDGKPHIMTGDEAKAFIKERVLEERVGDVDHLKGSVACLGEATGAVRIVNTASDMKKMQDGDILVSIATIPEIVPAMKKAAAIVTDIGGITSHAAIVSRELGVPCVIGTKFATQLLKDGDIVHVDANHGIVRVSKKKEP